MKKTIMEQIKTTAVIRIVDDDEAVRESYKFLIESDGWLVRTYANAEEFLEKDDPAVCGCGVFDIRMPGLSGMELQQKMIELSNTLPIIFVSAHGDIEMAVKAIQRGACDFLPKPVLDEKLLSAISKAVALSIRNKEESEQNSQVRRTWNALSPREKEVAVLVSEGLLNKIIADRLQISERTVHIHRANAAQKLGVKNAVGFSQVVEKVKAMGLA